MLIEVEDERDGFGRKSGRYSLRLRNSCGFVILRCHNFRRLDVALTVWRWLKGEFVDES